MGRPARRRLDGTTRALFTAPHHLTIEQAALALSTHPDFDRRSRAILPERLGRKMVEEVLADDSWAVWRDPHNLIPVAAGTAERHPKQDAASFDQMLARYTAALDRINTWSIYKPAKSSEQK